MSADVLIGDGEAARLMPHPLRAAMLGEVHARPFTPISVPSRVMHFAFDTSGARAQADRANLIAFCTSRGLPPPSPAEKHHRAPFGSHDAALGAAFRIHHLYLGNAGRPGGMPFHPDAASLASPMRMVPQPGPLLVAVDLHLLAEDAATHRAGAAVRQRQPGGCRELRWRRGLRHRLSARSFRLRAHPGRRPQHVAGTRRRVGSAGDRARDLSHTGTARPARSAAARRLRSRPPSGAWSRSPSRCAAPATRQPITSCWMN